MKARAFNRIVWIFGLFLLGVYFLLDPESPGFPKCPVLLVTGYQCPGCGSQRALHQLLQGNLQQAMSYNLLFLPAMMYGGIGWFLENTAIGARFPTFRRIFYGFYAIMLVLAMALAYGVLRNIL